MTDDQIAEWIKTLPLGFRSSLTGRVRYARQRTRAYKELPHGTEKKEAFRSSRNAQENASTFLDGALEAHGHVVHTDVLSLFIIQIIDGHRAKDF